VLDGVGKDFLRLAKIIAGVKQAIDSQAVPRPLLDFVEVADVRNQRVVGFFVWLVVHVRRTSSYGMFRYIQRNPDRSYLSIRTIRRRQLSFGLVHLLLRRADDLHTRS
jgi:hypothetical protein